MLCFFRALLLFYVGLQGSSLYSKGLIGARCPEILHKSLGFFYRPQRTVQTRFEFIPIRDLGHGTYGRVGEFEQKDLETGQRVLFALKEARAEKKENRQYSEDLLRYESWVYTRVNPKNRNPHFLRHNGLKRIGPETRGLVLEHSSRGDLWKQMTQVMRHKKSFKERARFAGWAVKEVFLATESLHKAGFLHGDIKEANLLVGEDGHLKLIDLASASLRSKKADSRGNHAQTGASTDGYASPERITKRNVDFPSDYFALGTIFANMDYFLLHTKLDKENISIERARAWQQELHFREWFQKNLVAPLTEAHPQNRLSSPRKMRRLIREMENIIENLPDDSA